MKKLTEALGDLDLAGDLQKVPETTEFNTRNAALTTWFQKPWRLAQPNESNKSSSKTEAFSSMQ